MSQIPSTTQLAMEQTDFLPVPAGSPYRKYNKPRINILHPPLVQQMVGGHKVFIFIENVADRNGPTLASTAQVPLKALAHIFPVVEAALKAHNLCLSSKINNVVLPAGGLRAYQEVVLWVSDVVAAGKLVPLRKLKSTPLSCYTEIILIANRLRNVYLGVGMRRRIEQHTTVSDSRPFSLCPGDVRYLYQNLPPDHFARQKMLSAFATAMKNSQLHPSFAAKLTDLFTEVPGIKEELDQTVVALA